LIEETKKSYFHNKTEADKSNLRIEEAMLNVQRGELEPEDLQKIS
jgi:hypothetical protein